MPYSEALLDAAIGVGILGFRGLETAGILPYCPLDSFTEDDWGVAYGCAPIVVGVGILPYCELLFELSWVAYGDAPVDTVGILPYWELLWFSLNWSVDFVRVLKERFVTDGDDGVGILPYCDAVLSAAAEGWLSADGVGILPYWDEAASDVAEGWVSAEGWASADGVGILPYWDAVLSAAADWVTPEGCESACFNATEARAALGIVPYCALGAGADAESADPEDDGADEGVGIRPYWSVDEERADPEDDGVGILPYWSVDVERAEPDDNGVGIRPYWSVDGEDIDAAADDGVGIRPYWSVDVERAEPDDDGVGILPYWSGAAEGTALAVESPLGIDAYSLLAEGDGESVAESELVLSGLLMPAEEAYPEAPIVVDDVDGDDNGVGIEPYWSVE
jgi:hypothetical protein